MADTLTVKNLEQAILFKGELVGQLSDGAWENSKPYDHWKQWSRCKVVIGSSVGRNFWAQKDNYNLTGSSLLKIIGPRMIGMVKLAKTGYLKLQDAGQYEGAEAFSDFGCSLDNWDMPTEKSIDDEYNDILTKSKNDKYYSNKVKSIDNIFGGIDGLKKVILSNSYNKQQLIKDLNELKVAMRTFNN